MKGVAFVLCSLCASALAQLKWDKGDQEFHPSLYDTNVIAHFTFKNAGDCSIALTSATSSCGCIIPALEKKTYLPGESGSLPVNFVFGQRVGPQQNEITVRTNDPRTPGAILTLRVVIPELLKLTPGFIYWRKGEEKTQKSITIRAASDAPLHIVNVSSSNEKFILQLTTNMPGREYLLHVTPVGTSAYAWTSLRIETDFPSDRPRIFNAYAQVRAY